MNELAKVEPKGLIENFQDYVLQGVSKELRQSASKAVEWFEEKPCGQGQKFDLLALKLAGHFHRVGATPNEVIAACVYLDTRTTFRPGVMEYLNAIEEIRRANTAKEIAGYEIYTDEHGNKVFCTPETAEVNNWERG